MKSIRLKIERELLLDALTPITKARRKKFARAVPVWLFFDPGTQELRIEEDRGIVAAFVPALGVWPAAGVTIDLLMLKRALGKCKDPNVELYAVHNGVLLSSGNLDVKMKLLDFGPELCVASPIDHPDRPHPMSDLPLFRWATWRW